MWVMSLGTGLLGAAGPVTQLLRTLALGVPNTFSGEPEPGIWLRRGRGQSLGHHPGEQDSALSLGWTLLAQLCSLCGSFLLFSHPIYIPERGQRTVTG